MIFHVRGWPRWLPSHPSPAFGCPSAPRQNRAIPRFAHAAKASFPFAAKTTRWPAFSSSRIASFWLTGLSSASRMLRDAAFGPFFRRLRGLDRDAPPWHEAQDGQNGVEQLGLANGFGEAHVHAKFPAPRGISKMPFGRKQQDDGARQGGILANSFQHAKSVDSRHLRVQHDNGERMAGRPRRFHRAKSRLRRLRPGPDSCASWSTFRREFSGWARCRQRPELPAPAGFAPRSAPGFESGAVPLLKVVVK